MFVKLFDSLFAHPFHKDVWWKIGSPVVAYQPKGAASLAASYTNLANSGTYDAAPGVAPTWNATDGWIFNGVNQYLTTGFTPSDVNTTAIVKYKDMVGNDYIFGVTSGGGKTIAMTNSYYFSNWSHSGSAVAAGIKAITQYYPYLNGVEQSSIKTAAALAITHSFFIGCINNVGSPIIYGEQKIQAFALYSNTLSTAEIQAVTQAMEAI